MKTNGIKPEVIVRNKLTSRAQKGVNRLKTFVKNSEGYNIGVKQDYSKNRVELQLLSRSYFPQESGYQVYQTRYIPTTSAAKTYTKTVKEMMQAEREAVTPAPVRKSPLTRIMELLGM